MSLQIWSFSFYRFSSSLLGLVSRSMSSSVISERTKFPAICSSSLMWKNYMPRLLGMLSHMSRTGSSLSSLRKGKMNEWKLCPENRLSMTTPFM